jgi:hypothetical protein
MLARAPGCALTAEGNPKALLTADLNAGVAGQCYASGMSQLKSLLMGAIVCAGAFTTFLPAQEPLPVGTVFAVVLDTPLDSRKCKPGQPISGHIAQEVPMENKRAIRAGATILGQVTSAESGPGIAKLGLRFDRVGVGREQVAIRVAARAVASFTAIAGAGKPNNIIGTSPNTWTMPQIGDDAVYGAGGGKVENQKGEVVGKSVPGGVLVNVSNKPGSMCEGMPLPKSPQATWLFSAAACGVYGSSRLQLENGTDTKDGEILFTIRNKKEDRLTHVKLAKGTALLLTIAGAPGR